MCVFAGRGTLQARRHCDVSGLAQADGLSGCRRQVDIAAANPRTAVIDANGDASAMANPNLSAEREAAMGGCHCCTIESLSARDEVVAD